MNRYDCHVIHLNMGLGTKSGSGTSKMESCSYQYHLANGLKFVPHHYLILLHTLFYCIILLIIYMLFSIENFAI